jgi:hypothetical protein
VSVCGRAGSCTSLLYDNRRDRVVHFLEEDFAITPVLAYTMPLRAMGFADSLAYRNCPSGVWRVSPKRA